MWYSFYLTLYNVCAVPWGVFSTVGDIMSTVGDILSTVGGVQYRGGYHDKCGGISWVPWGVFSTVGGYHEYRGGLSWVPWGMFSTVGDIMMHVGGYHEYRGGCSVPWGDTILWNLSTVGGYHDACGGISWVPWGVFSTVGYSNNNWLFPPRYWTPSTVLMISPHVHHDIPPRYWTSPTVLNIPTVLKITPHGTHDIPPLYWTPPRYSRYPPTFIMISPHGTEHPPRYSRYPPRYSWYPPRYWTPPTVLHTHYTGCIWYNENSLTKIKSGQFSEFGFRTTSFLTLFRERGAFVKDAKVYLSTSLTVLETDHFLFYIVIFL